MPTILAAHAFKRAEEIGRGLYRITVTNPWYGNSGGNITRAQASPLSGVLAGIRSAGGRAEGRVTRMGADEWLDLGRTVLQAGRGVCTDCAAAAAYSYLQTDSIRRVEIISVGTHAFVIVGRSASSELAAPGTWGQDAFVLDIWFANQFPYGDISPVGWMFDRTHPVVDWIYKSARKLRVEVSLQGEPEEQERAPTFSVPAGRSQAAHLMMAARRARELDEAEG